MSFSFSVVIICKDAAATIGSTLASVQGLSDDLVVYDSGSTDATLDIIQQYGARLYHGTWLGFGGTRQKAASLAKHQWVLMVDADEALTESFKDELRQLPADDAIAAYAFRLQHYLGKQRLRWGVWRNDYRLRLYDKTRMRWNNKIIHETLEAKGPSGTKKLRSPVLHLVANNLPSFQIKMNAYAALTAMQYKREGRKVSRLQPYLSAGFNFLQQYLLQLGFLDGRAGFRLARVFGRYSYEKYKRLLN